MRASALDLGKFGITVNCIAPGPFVTELTLPRSSLKKRVGSMLIERPWVAGASPGAGRSGNPISQRSRQLHHRDLPDRGRRYNRESVIASERQRSESFGGNGERTQPARQRLGESLRWNRPFLQAFIWNKLFFAL